MFENPRRGTQARNFTTNVPKLLDLKSSFEQILSENWRWMPLIEEDTMSLSIFYYCICAFLCRCLSFNPSLCRLSPFSAVICRCFKAMSLVEIYPNRASASDRYVSVPSDPFMVVVADYLVLMSFKYSLKVKIKVKIYNFPLCIITTNIII